MTYFTKYLGFKIHTFQTKTFSRHGILFIKVCWFTSPFPTFYEKSCYFCHFVYESLLIIPTYHIIIIISWKVGFWFGRINSTYFVIDPFSYILNLFDFISFFYRREVVFPTPEATVLWSTSQHTSGSVYRLVILNSCTYSMYFFYHVTCTVSELYFLSWIKVSLFYL